MIPLLAQIEAWLWSWYATALQTQLKAHRAKLTGHACHPVQSSPSEKGAAWHSVPLAAEAAHAAA